MTASKATRAAPIKSFPSSSKLVLHKDSISSATKPPRHTPPTAAAITAQLLQQKYAQELAQVLKSQYPEWLQLVEKQVKQQQAAKAAAAAAALADPDKPAERPVDKVDDAGINKVVAIIDTVKVDTPKVKTITPLVAKTPAAKRTRKSALANDSTPTPTSTPRKRKPRTPKPKQDVKAQEAVPVDDIESSLLFSDLDPAVLQSPSPSSHHLAHAAAAIRIQSLIDAQVPRTLRRDCFFSLPLIHHEAEDMDEVIQEDSPPVTPRRSISPSLVSDTGSSDDHVDVDDDFDVLSPLGGFLDENVDLTTEILSPYSLDDDAIEPIQAPIVKSQSDALYPLAPPFELDTTLFEPVVVSPQQLETVSAKRSLDDIVKAPAKRVRVVTPDEQ